MKKVYTSPELVVTAYSAENAIMVSSATTQTKINSKNYSSLVDNF